VKNKMEKFKVTFKIQKIDFYTFEIEADNVSQAIGLMMESANKASQDSPELGKQTLYSIESIEKG
jgi:hypothetical protein